MPRAGPRPYECVRRAWHSDRHQPIRGSLIQEIFRVVNEIHSFPTKKNKEWQEMLPIVVLKAEEILYSKANSKDEYMNFNTLRDRLVEAINTIIQLDETTETGEFLQPCIEAALNLGCTPRRASRSQRNNNSISYLRPRNQEYSQGVTTNSRYIPNFWSSGKPVTIVSKHSGSRFQSLGASYISTTANFHATLSPHTVMKNGLGPNKFSIYPLYYGSDIHYQGQHSGSEITPKPVSRFPNSTKREILENSSAFDTVAANGITQNDARFSLENHCNNKCDLALRLGPLSASSPSNGNKTPSCVFKDFGSGSSLEEKKINDCSLKMEMKLPSFPMVNAYGKREWNVEGECVDVEARMSKQKASFSHSLGRRHLCWLPKLPFGTFIG